MQKEPINAQEWRAASKMLNRAAELIQERGWQQGALTDVSQECAATSLEHAFREGEYSIVEFNYAHAALILSIGEPKSRVAAGTMVDLETIEANMKAGRPAVPYWGHQIIKWNDYHARTEDEVVATLQNATKLAHSWALKS